MCTHCHRADHLSCITNTLNVDHFNQCIIEVKWNKVIHESFNNNNNKDRNNNKRKKHKEK